MMAARSLQPPPASSPCIFHANAAFSPFVLSRDGLVGIGNTGPSYILDVSGHARFTGGYTTSDQRWKTNIEPLKDSLGLVTKLQGVSFDWKRKGFPNTRFAEGKQIGFIAQEVEKILPTIVSTNKDGYKNLSYESVTPVLVEAMKELKADNDNLRAELAKASAANDNEAVEINALKARLDKLEAAKH